jgi:hypothetical protein
MGHSLSPLRAFTESPVNNINDIPAVAFAIFNPYLVILARKIETDSCLHVQCIHYMPYIYVYIYIWDCLKIPLNPLLNQRIFPIISIAFLGHTSFSNSHIPRRPIGAPHHSSERTASWSCCLAYGTRHGMLRKRNMAVSESMWVALNHPFE